MTSRRVLVISGAGLVAYHRDGSRLAEPFSFGADEEGHGQFARYLERFPDDITCVIVDLVEEEFREETIPHVLGRERRAMLRSKADRLFRSVPYVHSTMLGRAADGRRDDRVLFSALTRPEMLAPWLAAMARHGVPLAGICSPAMLTARLLKAIGAGGGQVLVVSRQAAGGLRQTFFRRGRLRMSRLAAIADSAPDRYPSSSPPPSLSPPPSPPLSPSPSWILAEVERTRRYLGSLYPGAEDGRLEVHVLSHGEPLEALRSELARDAGGELALDAGGGLAPDADGELRTGCRAVDLAEVARRLGMRRWGGESTADPLFVHLLARGAAPNHYATQEETRGFAVVRARSVLKAASVALVAGSALWGGVTFVEGTIASGHARALALQAAYYEDRYRKAQAGLPPAPVEPSEIERVVSAVHTLRSHRADPVDLLARIADTLAAFPRVRIERIAWRVSDDAEAEPEVTGHGRPSHGGGAGGAVRAFGHPGDRNATRNASQHDSDTPQHDSDTSRQDSKALFHIALVGARIEPFDGDFRDAIDTVRRFAAALAAIPGAEHVRVASLPLDLSSKQTLAGEVGAAAGSAAFEIRVALRATIPMSREPEPTARGRPGADRPQGGSG